MSFEQPRDVVVLGGAIEPENRARVLREQFPNIDYVSFEHGVRTVCLDGHFTSEQLRFIADLLDRKV